MLSDVHVEKTSNDHADLDFTFDECLDYAKRMDIWRPSLSTSDCYGIRKDSVSSTPYVTLIRGNDFKEIDVMYISIDYSTDFFADVYSHPITYEHMLIQYCVTGKNNEVVQLYRKIKAGLNNQESLLHQAAAAEIRRYIAEKNK